MTKLSAVLSKDWRQALAERKKLVAYAATVAGEAVAFGVLTGTAREWVMFALALAGGGGVHQVKNVESKD